MEKDKVLNSIKELHDEIDATITDLVSARLAHDEQKEGRALFKMESLLVGCQQELSFLYDFFSE